MRGGTGSWRKRSSSHWMRYDVPGHAVGDCGSAAAQTPRRNANRIVNGLRVLEEDPSRPRPKADIRAAEGTDPRKDRIRIGDYRAIYAVVEREAKVVETLIRGRGYRTGTGPSRSR